MNKLKLIVLLVVITAFSCKTAKYPDLSDGVYADIQTNKGDILLQLEYQKTPMTVANFVSLSEGTNTYVTKDDLKGKPFYDGLKFHRVIKDFMIQGGDPQGTGAGGPGYKFKDEFDESLTHSGPGIFSMANSGVATNGSQFFITHKATSHLNGKHTVFGHVTIGQDVVNTIAKNDVIDKVVIIRVGKEAKAFDAAKVFESHFKEMESASKLIKEKADAKLKELFANEAKAKEYTSGLKIFVSKKGTGTQPIKGQKVKMHYTGYLRNGKMFDSSVAKNKPFTTVIGVGQVIQGWDEGVVTLKEGGKATFYIPAHLAWGSRGSGRAIPPNADVIFEVELLEVLK